MQTQLSPIHRDSPAGQEANAILRSCVHCGFCTATCPTYQLFGDELDGPRGRIYLIKQALEGGEVSRKTQQHLDRCLGCRACETTCPSGVRYGRLLDIGRAEIERRVPRRLGERLARRLLRAVVPHSRRFAGLLRLARGLRPLLPGSLRDKVPSHREAGNVPNRQHPRVMLALAGCAQSVATPATHAAAARVLDRLGIQLQLAPTAGCCGALSHHLGAEAEALGMARRNIDAWWPALTHGAEAIVVSASGCGAQVKDYGALLAQDPAYADKAARVSAVTRDLAEILAGEDLARLGQPGQGQRIAVHVPCSLQHGQKLPGVLENVLDQLGFTLSPVADAHLCCGSAGSYSLLQPGIARQLRDNKLACLLAGGPDAIVTANIGCQLHLESGTTLPVKHWIELLDSK
jgi:glycolate oxidase iron-sulfur subunit